MKVGLLIRDLHDLHTALNLIKDFGSNLTRILSMISSGKWTDILVFDFPRLLKFQQEG